MKKAFLILEIILVIFFVIGCKNIRTTNSNGIERALSTYEYTSYSETGVDTTKPDISTEFSSEDLSNNQTESNIQNSTEINNTTYPQETESETNTSDLSENTNNTKITDNKTEKIGSISKNIVCNDKTLNIDASVYGSDTSVVSEYQYSYLTVNAQPIINELIGTDINTFVCSDYEGLRYSGTVNGKPAEYQLYLGFSFQIIDECSAANKYLGQHTDTMAPGCSKSLSECRTLADTLMSKYCTSSYTDVKSSVLDQTNCNSTYSKTGYYEYTYYQYIDGLELYDYTAGGVIAVGKVVISDNTIHRFDCTAPVYSSINSAKPLTAQEATNILESQINNFYQCTLGTITEIRLQYITSYDYYPDTLFPAWVFYDKTGGHCFAVNAITGAVIEFSYNG